MPVLAFLKNTLSIVSTEENNLFSLTFAHTHKQDKALQCHLHQTWSVPLRGSVVVVDIVSPPQVVNLFLPARRQWRRWQLLLALRRRVVGINHIPSVLRNESRKDVRAQVEERSCISIAHKDKDSYFFFLFFKI